MRHSKEYIASLEREFPGKRIICVGRLDNPRVIDCAIEPTELHPNYSVNVVLIEKDLPHLHEKTTQVYAVENGRLVLYVDDKERTLGEKERFSIAPGQIHRARSRDGNLPARVRVHSTPGHTKEDTFLVLEVIRRNWPNAIGNISLSSKENRELLKDAVDAYIYEGMPPLLGGKKFGDLTRDIGVVLIDGTRFRLEERFDRSGITSRLFLTPEWPGN